MLVCPWVGILSPASSSLSASSWKAPYFSSAIPFHGDVLPHVSPEAMESSYYGLKPVPLNQSKAFLLEVIVSGILVTLTKG